MLACFTERRERHGGEANSWPLLYALLACINGTFLQEQLGSSPLERALSHLEVGEKWVGEERQQARRSESHFICVRWQTGSCQKEMLGKKKRKKKVGYTPKHIRGVCAKKWREYPQVQDHPHRYKRDIPGTCKRSESEGLPSWLFSLFFLFFFTSVVAISPFFCNSKPGPSYENTLAVGLERTLTSKGFSLEVTGTLLNKGPRQMKQQCQISPTWELLRGSGCSSVLAAHTFYEKAGGHSCRPVLHFFQFKHWHCCGSD